MSRIKNPVDQRLQEVPFLILDGALATELEQKGFDLNDPLWSARLLIEAPEQIEHVHRDYFEVGADVAITSSYQASIEGFKQRHITTEEAQSLIRQTVTLAQNARTRSGKSDALIAGSVGPYGAYLADGSEYRGHYGVSADVLEAFHRPRIEALIEAGADLLAFETIPSLEEAVVLFRILEAYPEVSAWLTFSLQDATHISEGTALATCIETVGQHPQLAAIGANCFPASYATDFIRHVKALTNVPIIVYPNSGEVYDPVAKTWSGTNQCTSFQTVAKTWYEAGARLIGGCCRTSPEHIAQIRSVCQVSTTS